ncbi:Uronate isomerase [Frankliniella fusca]|uniref:Uronate isomerase n=1 Tax=Frankliniella fusca TaxID=407009 RepID=A0AAE1HVG9_9NEOP|nr:Uronate isomerase [Frankliniella fusca]
MDYQNLVKVSGSLVCGTCQTDDIYTGTAALNDHYKKRHLKLSNYVCGQLGCRKNFRDLTSMIRHITSTHKIIFETENNQDLQLQHVQVSDDIEMDTCCEDDNTIDGSDDSIHASLEEEELDNEEDLGTIQEQLDRAAVKLLLGLRTKASLTGAAVESIKKRVTARLQEKGVTAEDAQEVLSELDTVADPFRRLRTIDQQLNYYEKHYGLVKPVQKVLGTRIDMRLDPATNCQVPTQVNNTFQYASIIQSLTTFLKNKKYRDIIFKNKQVPSNDNVLRSYADGTHFKNHPYIHNHEGVIQVILFFDELEIANSLGSKTIIHKLATFFGQVINLPPEVSSQLSSIFLVALAHADDLKKDDAMEKVLTPLILELKKLAQGIEVEIDSVMYVIRAVLVVLTADTLAAHDILGFLGPGASCFCRRCMVTRAEVRQNANAVGALRTPEEHKRHLDQVKATPAFSTQCGVKKSCPLDQAPFFDCTSSNVFDAFHDVLEGVAPLDVKLVLRHFVCVQRLFSVKDLNNRIASFAYGIPDAKKKPSPNLTREMLLQSGGKLKQTGSQMWCLIRSLPFLIGDYVPEDSRHMQLIFCLQNIMQVIFSFEIKVADLDRMDEMIELHNQSFKELFVDAHGDDFYIEEPFDNLLNNELEEQAVDEPEGENAYQNVYDRVQEGEEQQGIAGRAGAHRGPRRKKVHITNKLHHLKHYREMALAFGPPVRMWCAKFEGRMKIFRQHASICCNFKNPPMTMAKMFQLSSLTAMLGNADESLDFQRGTVMSTINSSHRELLKNEGLNDTDEVMYTNCATLNGEEYRPNLFVCLPGDPSTEIGFALMKDSRRRWRRVAERSGDPKQSRGRAPFAGIASAHVPILPVCEILDVLKRDVSLLIPFFDAWAARLLLCFGSPLRSATHRHLRRESFITSVIVVRKEVFLVLTPWKNEGLCPRLNAYHVVPDNRPLVLLRPKLLRHFRCIAPWTAKNSEALYLSMRIVLV